ncbi:bifunctional diaminohydroxyphosphoribosylaminopyrimidine deaminase/5-amino-6-(5-phosphoribosylamino)uracil reductase RibD [Flavihumibacter stibioxidans]|uniref:Riboflavin biosynthesis protein RibD n=1 Tax=Flavihumibacter stibioxidans TaxID=1834163 RepID=A0ABR7MD54_9BACT|nr:bifunctional diaminohydroxyphosphoribosylaminopyrimidine deaminase/5-amino-6-(5-phosphoribosylamino)uracil reductase RibD [Flavihumibacter stibioxidans]MBC6492576.1 riboflavin biosynthesis protein RibD [Flavihumibacter stibioxidans]
MRDHSEYMHRCLQLARLGAGYVAPNPMVGAVLVHKNRIIGEGYHQLYGKAHAEVNCLDSVKAADRQLIAASTLYVSLEPCAHFGKTPPCADLVILHRIPKVVVGSRDPFKAVDGKGIEKMQAAGIEVITGVLENECRELNKRFFTFHTKQRPYIILKWAQSANGCIAGPEKEGVGISQDLTNRLVHRWRSEEQAIAIGTATALIDNPSLTTRHVSGPNPVRILLDKELKVPSTNAVLSDEADTIVLNYHREDKQDHVQYVKLTQDEPVVEQMTRVLYGFGMLSVIIEGGSLLLQSFIDAGCWDEARIITNPALVIPGGYKGPILREGELQESLTSGTDLVHIYRKHSSVQ